MMSKAIPMQDLQHMGPCDLAFCLARIVQEYPELRKLIEAWPQFREDTRAVFLRITEIP